MWLSYCWTIVKNKLENYRFMGTRVFVYVFVANFAYISSCKWKEGPDVFGREEIHSPKSVSIALTSTILKFSAFTKVSVITPRKSQRFTWTCYQGQCADILFLWCTSLLTFLFWAICKMSLNATRFLSHLDYNLPYASIRLPLEVHTVLFARQSHTVLCSSGAGFNY